MSLRIDPAGKYKFIRGLNNDNTVVLVERKDNSEKCVLREVSRRSLDVYQKIYRNPHENVETVRKISRVNGGYIAECEFCKGVTLRELMENDPSLLRIGICQISEQLCDAAQHFYKLGLVHRDITPNNIIINFWCYDKKLDLKLIDFDISRRRYGDKSHDTTLYGTVGYAAPEQYGFGETDFRTDIYAVGRVIADMFKVCGSMPEFQKMWEFVILKSTMYSPDERYKSYEIMKKDVVKIWEYKKALLAVCMKEYKKALQLFFFGEDPNRDRNEKDFLVI